MTGHIQPDDLEVAALLVIDMQNGFCSPAGGLAGAGVDITRQQAVVPRVAELVRLCRGAEIPVVWTKTVHYPEDAARARRRIPSHLGKRGLQLCAAGTPDAEIFGDLQPLVDEGDLVVEKHRSSAFYDTSLDTKLRMLGAEVLILSGVTSNFCVDTTARDAYARDYDLLLIRDCVAASFEDLHAAFIKNFEIYLGEAIALDQFRALVATTNDKENR
jgi:ureidoacrylate peracid hydrolase